MTPQLWQQGVAPVQQPAPVGVRQGSVPVQDAHHAFVPPSSQLRQQGVAPVQRSASVGVRQGSVPSSTSLATLETSLTALHDLAHPPPPIRNSFRQSSTATVAEERPRPIPFWEIPGHPSSAFENFRFKSSSAMNVPQAASQTSQRRTTGQSTSAQPSRELTPSHPQPSQPSANKGKQRAGASNLAALSTRIPQVHDGFGFQFTPNNAPQVSATLPATSPLPASQPSRSRGLTTNDIVNIWESLPPSQKDAMLSAYATGQPVSLLNSSTVPPPVQQAPACRLGQLLDDVRPHLVFNS